MISQKIFLNECVCVVVSVLTVNLYWLASHSRLVEPGNDCSSRDGVSGTGHYWSSPQLISPQDIWLMLQRGWKLQFVKVCFTVCYTQWWKVRCSWLSTLTQIANYPTSALIFSGSGCFRLFTLLFCIKSIKYRSCHFIQWFLALLSVTIVLLTSLCLLSSQNCCGLLVSFWINGFALKTSEFGTIVKSDHFYRIKDTVSDILYSIHCQQLRPKSSHSWLKKCWQCMSLQTTHMIP